MTRPSRQFIDRHVTEVLWGGEHRSPAATALRNRCDGLTVDQKARAGHLATERLTGVDVADHRQWRQRLFTELAKALDEVEHGHP